MSVIPESNSDDSRKDKKKGHKDNKTDFEKSGPITRTDKIKNAKEEMLAKLNKIKEMQQKKSMKQNDRSKQKDNKNQSLLSS